MAHCVGVWNRCVQCVSWKVQPRRGAQLNWQSDTNIREPRVSGILCVRHSMRSDYAQTTEDPIGQP